MKGYNSPNLRRRLRYSFGRLRELCEDLRPGDYRVLTHVDVGGGRSLPAQN